MSAQSEFEAELQSELGRQSMACDASVLEGLSAHFELMLKWGRKMNLTSIFNPKQAARLHAVDSLFFDQLLPSAERIIDAGSGAGFPGIVLALRRPETELVLLEPLQKRCSFLRVVVSHLRLPNVRVVEGRVEPEGSTAPVGHFGAAVSRATWAPLEWIGLGVQLLESGGHLVVSGGRGAHPPERVAEAGRRVGLGWLRRRSLRLGDADRVLDLLRLTA
ncbi:MAG: 16S rRNA (guanine(527)-N(7))-methyltransferase RsmG [Myxococcota bacterium]